MGVEKLQLPIIRRARDYYLYDAQQQRWLDFWLDDGQAFFGHRPQRLALHLKKIIDRGLYARYPSYESLRLLKRLSSLEEGFPVVAYYRYRKEPETAEPFIDSPVLLKKWRPGWHDYRCSQLLDVQLPLAGFQSPRFLLMREEKSKAEIEKALGVGLEKESRLISPLVASALMQILQHIKAAKEQQHEQEELQWFDSQLWCQRWGSYLRFIAAEHLYTPFWLTMAKAKLLFPPSASQLAIVPALMSANDWQKLFGAGKDFMAKYL